MQDVVAIAVAVAAGIWLVRTLSRQLFAPSCGKVANPTGADGFVPLGDLTATTKKPGRPDGRPGARNRWLAWPPAQLRRWRSIS